MNGRNKALLGWAGAALCALAVMACGGGDPPLLVTRGTVIQNATVVDTRNGSLAQGRSIVLDGGRITHVTDRTVTVSDNAQAINASGKFVVPGYNDMHAHVMDAADASPPHWPLLIANGVTGVREMSGAEALIERVRQLNADSAAGLVDLKGKHFPKATLDRMKADVAAIHDSQPVQALSAIMDPHHVD